MLSKELTIDQLKAQLRDGAVTFDDVKHLIDEGKLKQALEELENELPIPPPICHV